jgi:DNA (cytosine-5)-methyltransferase 1
MRPWFNEFDGFAARWLRNLYPESAVDERSIRDLGPDDVVGGRCHFFAGIAGWELALDLAGWPEDREVWTGSCPCQPYSAAGKRKGDADERNLWPDFFRLIRERHPDTIFGEQVEGAIRHGWLDGICRDLEGEGYAVGHCVLGAHSAGAPHIRQRLLWVADSQLQRTGEGTRQVEPPELRGDRPSVNGDRRRLGDADEPGPQGRIERRDGAGQWAAGTASLVCLDGRTRRIPTEPRFQPLAHGVPGRVGRLRAYGNAIVPQVAAEFIGAFMECHS